MGERAETQQRVFSDASQEKPWLAMLLLLKPQLNLNTTSTVVGFDMKMTVQTPPHPPTHTNFSGTSGRARELKFGTDTH